MELSHEQILPCRIPVARGILAATVVVKWQGLITKLLCQEGILFGLMSGHTAGPDLVKCFPLPKLFYMYIFVTYKRGALCVKTRKMSFHSIKAESIRGGSLATCTCPGT